MIRDTLTTQSRPPRPAASARFDFGEIEASLWALEQRRASAEKELQSELRGVGQLLTDLTFLLAALGPPPAGQMR